MQVRKPRLDGAGEPSNSEALNCVTSPALALDIGPDQFRHDRSHMRNLVHIVFLFLLQRRHLLSSRPLP